VIGRRARGVGRRSEVDEKLMGSGDWATAKALPMPRVWASPVYVTSSLPERSPGEGFPDSAPVAKLSAPLVAAASGPTARLPAAGPGGKEYLGSGLRDYGRRPAASMLSIGPRSR